MAYKFPLESILKHRKRQEELAQREHIEARMRLEECINVIEQMYRQIDETRASILEAQRSKMPESMPLICESETFIEAQKFRIHEQRQQARELIRVLEQKEEQLLEKLHERKVIEKLKEKGAEEYKVRMARIEQKELDDLTNARHSVGGRR